MFKQMDTTLRCVCYKWWVVQNSNELVPPCHDPVYRSRWVGDTDQSCWGAIWGGDSPTASFCATAAYGRLILPCGSVLSRLCDVDMLLSPALRRKLTNFPSISQQLPILPIKASNIQLRMVLPDPGSQPAGSFF